ncbi:hypothetical protein KLEPA_00102 (plasmid) [Klebsiella pneumoniae]
MVVSSDEWMRRQNICHNVLCSVISEFSETVQPLRNYSA